MYSFFVTSPTREKLFINIFLRKGTFVYHYLCRQYFLGRTFPFKSIRLMQVKRLVFNFVQLSIFVSTYC